jgi:hypothetical protein
MAEARARRPERLALVNIIVPTRDPSVFSTPRKKGISRE